ncbi:hypothetical protein CDL12_21033 [Handroanthus impetiginosus]|uniref:RING-type E3 ubiquitin transferase n=1 Tax=Handroanthus impetiginosus TaxID=429701 RepID=A0A2G9GMC2_9LAMI|nr:hypothetical protein CDL12_21033 [Handroanthus impetiginosus]
MDVLIVLNLFFFLCVSPLVKASDANTTCKSANCSLFSPEIRFPFRLQNLQPHHCGLPQFNLFCRENRTMIHFPSYGDLVVKSISYDTRRLNLLDPRNCVHEVFLNLNLSLTPFSYYYVVERYKYINCSDKLAGSFEQVPCLSGSDHHVYVVASSFRLPGSCSFVKTVAVPFSYSRYLSESSFGLAFTWNSGLNEESDCETGQPEKYFKTFYGVSGIMVLVFIVGMLFHATISEYREELNEEKVIKDMSREGEIDQLLGEYQGI